MTPNEFRECLALLRWSQRGLADILGIHDTAVRRWASGKNEIPENVSAWLKIITANIKVMPLPENWKISELND